MTFGSAYERHRLGERRRTFMVCTLIAVAIAHLLDRPAYFLFALDSDVDDALGLVRSMAWYQIAHQTGALVTWLIVAGVLALIALGTPDVGQRFKELPGRLVCAVAAAALVAETGKRIFGREGPTPEGWYSFKRPLGAFWESSNLGVPSSHAAIAFAACALIAWTYPRSGWVLLPLAAMCAISKLLVGSHFLSDVVLGGAIGLGAGVVAAPRDRSPAP